MMIEGSVFQEDIIILNVYEPHTVSMKIMINYEHQNNARINQNK